MNQDDKPKQLWIPAFRRKPNKGQVVLATVEEVETGLRTVVPCVYDWKMNPVTGEILGPETFMLYASEGMNDASIDYNDNKDFRTIAWMYYPKPYIRFAVIVAGSRSFMDYPLVKDKLDKLFVKHKPSCIVCGEACGADQLGKKYAQENNIFVESHPADWTKYGKSAGFIRNEEMACNADALVAFWNGRSSGTKHMIETAKRNGLQVKVVNV